MPIMKYYRKNVYGNELMYLADKNQKDAVEMISGRKSINPADMFALGMIGFTFEEVTESQAKALEGEK